MTLTATLVPYPGALILRGSMASVDIELTNPSPSPQAYDAVTLVDVTPSGTPLRRRVAQAGVVAPGDRALIRADIGQWARRDAGSHRVHAEIETTAATLTTPPLCIEVENGHYVDGSALAETQGDHGTLFALGLHRAAGHALLAAHDQPAAATTPPHLVALADAVGTFTVPVPLTARQPILPSGLTASIFPGGWDLVWLEDAAVCVSSLSPALPLERVDVPAPHLLLGAFRDPSHALTVLLVAGGALTHIELPPHHARTHPGRVTWSAPLPPELSQLVSGTAARTDTGYSLAFLAGGASAVTFAHATCDATAPPATYRFRAFPDADILGDAPPAIHGALLAGALLHLPQPRDAEEEPTRRWELATWTLAADTLETQPLDLPRPPESARLAFHAPFTAAGPGQLALAAAVLDDQRDVHLYAAGKMSAQGRSADEPLRIASDGHGIYVLQFDPARGPRLTPARW